MSVFELLSIRMVVLSDLQCYLLELQLIVEIWKSSRHVTEQHLWNFRCESPFTGSRLEPTGRWRSYLDGLLEERLLTRKTAGRYISSNWPLHHKSAGRT